MNITSGYTREELRAVADMRQGRDCPCLDYLPIPIGDWIGFHIQILMEGL